jgi:Flp pilus assembly protein TadB
MSGGGNVAIAIAPFILVVAMSSGSALAIAVLILAVGAAGPAYLLARQRSARIHPIRDELCYQGPLCRDQFASGHDARVHQGEVLHIASSWMSK